MLKNLFSKKTKIGGMIKHLGLEQFWLFCSTEEQNDLLRYYQDGVNVAGGPSLIDGVVTATSNTPLKLLYSMIGCAVADKNYMLADKLIEAGSNVEIGAKNLLDAHYFWQEAAECYYKQRDSRTDAIELTIKFCLQDIQMFPKYVVPMKQEFGFIPRILTFQRLAILYEKLGRYADAIDICNLAIQYELTDSTKGGYEERVNKLQKKLKQ